MKICSSCKQSKNATEFHVKSSMCKECKKSWVFDVNINFISATYSRILVRGKKEKHKLTDMTREDFIKWSLGTDVVDMLTQFNVTKERRLLPEIDRKNSSLAYTIDNIQWITREQHRAKTTSETIEVSNKHYIYTITGKIVANLSEAEAKSIYGMTNRTKQHMPSNGLFWKCPTEDMIKSAKAGAVLTAVKLGCRVEEKHILSNNEAGYKFMLIRQSRPLSPFIVTTKGKKSFSTKEEAIKTILKDLNGDV